MGARCPWHLPGPRRSLRGMGRPRLPCEGTMNCGRSWARALPSLRRRPEWAARVLLKTQKPGAGTGRGGGVWGVCWCSGGGGRGAGVGHLPERGAKFGGASSAWPGRAAGEGLALPLRSAPAVRAPRPRRLPQEPYFWRSGGIVARIVRKRCPSAVSHGDGCRGASDLASLIPCLKGSYFSLFKCAVDLYNFSPFLCFPNKPSLEWPQSCGLSLWTVAFAAGCQAWNCIDRSRGTTAPVTVFPQ